MYRAPRSPLQQTGKSKVAAVQAAAIAPALTSRGQSEKDIRRYPPEHSSGRLAKRRRRHVEPSNSVEPDSRGRFAGHLWARLGSNQRPLACEARASHRLKAADLQGFEHRARSPRDKTDSAFAGILGVWATETPRGPALVAAQRTRTSLVSALRPTWVIHRLPHPPLTAVWSSAHGRGVLRALATPGVRLDSRLECAAVAGRVRADRRCRRPNRNSSTSTSLLRRSRALGCRTHQEVPAIGEQKLESIADKQRSPAATYPTRWTSDRRSEPDGACEAARDLPTVLQPRSGARWRASGLLVGNPLGTPTGQNVRIIGRIRKNRKSAMRTRSTSNWGRTFTQLWEPTAARFHPRGGR